MGSEQNTAPSDVADPPPSVAPPPVEPPPPSGAPAEALGEAQTPDGSDDARSLSDLETELQAKKDQLAAKEKELLRELERQKELLGVGQSSTDPPPMASAPAVEVPQAATEAAGTVKGYMTADEYMRVDKAGVAEAATAPVEAQTEAETNDGATSDKMAAEDKSAAVSEVPVTPEQTAVTAGGEEAPPASPEPSPPAESEAPAFSFDLFSGVQAAFKQTLDGAQQEIEREIDATAPQEVKEGLKAAKRGIDSAAPYVDAVAKKVAPIVQKVRLA